MKLRTTNLSTTSDNGDVASVIQGIVIRADDILKDNDVDHIRLHTKFWIHRSIQDKSTIDHKINIDELSKQWTSAITKATTDYVRANRSKSNFFMASSQHDSESLLTIAVLIGHWEDLIANDGAAEHKATLAGFTQALAEQAKFIMDVALKDGYSQLVRLIYEIDALAGKYRGSTSAYDLVSQAMTKELGHRSDPISL